MSLVFIFNNINNIFLAGWSILIALLAVRFLSPLKFFALPSSISSKFGREEKFWWVRLSWVKNISYWWVVGVVVALHLFYGAFITWGQYYVWANGNTFTQSLISAPLPTEAPLPSILEWSRPSFEQPLGYFAYYVFGRVWLNIIILFVLSGFFYSIFKVWSIYRGGFLPNGPEIILATLLLAGYPGILVLVPLSFIASFTLFGILYFKNRTMDIQPMYIEPSFILVAPVALFFSKTIIGYL